jgi:hypothetical protein
MWGSEEERQGRVSTGPRRCGATHQVPGGSLMYPMRNLHTSVSELTTLPDHVTSLHLQCTDQTKPQL